MDSEISKGLLKLKGLHGNAMKPAAWCRHQREACDAGTAFCRLIVYGAAHGMVAS